MSDPIKLVIWDLDETFWRGTLSEGEVTLPPEHRSAVEALNRRGIVSSVCSKNDPELALATLDRLRCRQLFVFPHIAWQPKGEAVSRLLEEIHLRPVNVLFLDDNPQNRGEVEFYNPGIRTEGPEFISRLLDHPDLQGKPDPEETRLRHYRVLEAKSEDRREAGTSNEEFLRRCGIQAEIRLHCQPDLSRIHDLVQRAHQLNFTKARANESELLDLCRNPEYECGTVRVRDRYGDYGVCGFYALRDGHLEQFVFSCRIMDMGVESWLYHQLGRPELSIRGEVRGDPRQAPCPTWISDAGGGDVVSEPDPSADENVPRILLKGGCDLEQVIDFLGRRSGYEGEFNTVSPTGFPIHGEHTEILLRDDPAARALHEEVIDRLPFLDASVYETRFFAEDHEVKVYSTLMDLTQGLYRYRDTDFVVPYGDLLLDITRPEHEEELAGRERAPLDRDFLAWFRSSFSFEGGLSPEAFRRNLDALAARVPPDQQLILLNGAEYALEHPREKNRHQHHCRLNEVIDGFVADHGHVDLCDVRPLARRREDFSDNLRHYRRRVYSRIADELRELIGERWGTPRRRLLDSVRASSVYARAGLRSVVKGIRKAVR